MYIALILSRMNTSSFTDHLHWLSEFCILIEWGANKLSRRQNVILFYFFIVLSGVLLDTLICIFHFLEQFDFDR